ncbi:MAG: ABC transporter ATP-binding protein [Candidatus Rokuibacteriota bacterium]
MPPAPLMELRGVEFAYPGAARSRGRGFRVSGLSLTVAPGEILGVIGPNSAGKTTLIRLLTGVVRPAGGGVFLEGRPLAALSPWHLARMVAVVPQEMPQSFPFTVEQLVLMGRYPHAPARFFEDADDRAVAQEAMAATGVLDLAEAPVEGLSGGERQRVVLARALAQRPRLLVLDEPTAHLDLRYQVESVALLRRVNRERGVAILLVSHDLGLAAELSDRLLLMSEGRVAREGTPEHVLDEAALETVYGCRVIVEKNRPGEGFRVQVAWPERR